MGTPRDTLVSGVKCRQIRRISGPDLFRVVSGKVPTFVTDESTGIIENSFIICLKGNGVGNQ